MPPKTSRRKPDALLRHAIVASTYPGDIVLDCFAGSGSVSIAALETNRRTITLEIEEKWVSYLQSRLFPNQGILPG